MSKMFFGIGTAMVTPFSGGKVDLTAFEKLVRLQLEAGTEALIVNGTTGESSTLTDGEMCSLTERAKAVCEGRIPVIAGAGANCTRTAVRRAEQMIRAGADALLCVTPYYNRCNADGLLKHYLSIANASRVPVILYNVPSRTGVDLPVSTVTELFKHPMIRGVKEAKADPVKISELLYHIGNGGYVYAGEDGMLLPMLSMGAAGGICVASNAFPREMKKITQSALTKNFSAAKEAHEALQPVFSYLRSDVNPICIKALLSVMGLIENELRLPLTPMNAEGMKKAEELLKSLSFRSSF